MDSSFCGHVFVVDGDGSVRLPASCEVLTELYKRSGVRVRMVKPMGMTRRRHATVRKLIDELSLRHREMLSIKGSSGTPTAAFSNSDLLYGTDGLPRPSPQDDLVGSDISGYERDRQRLRDLELGNKRPQSKGKKTYSLVDRVSFERDQREEARVLNNSLPAKPPTFRNNGIRSSLVRGEQLLAQRTNSNPNTGRESDDLIAMGTLWSPANNNNNNNNNSGGSSGPNTRSSSTTTASNKSVGIATQNQNGSNNNNNNSTGINNNGNGSSQRKPLSVSMSSGRLHHSSSFNGISNTFGRQLSNSNKDDPKYPDPLHGAPASFQQRLMELASLEAETIRWERTKKVKKKPRQDKDS